MIINSGIGWDNISRLDANVYMMVASHMYVPGYTRDFVVKMVYLIFCCLQERNERNEYINDIFYNNF